MARGKVDQRVRLTRKLLKDALTDLMRTKHISEISVRELCEVAGINRSTFYSHYKDQHDLLHQIEKEVMDNLKSYLEKRDYIDNRPISAQVLTSILEYAKENANAFKALLSENCDFAFQQNVMELAQIVSFKYNKADERTQEYLTIFATNGIISIFQKWLQDGMLEPPTKISEIVLQAIYNGCASSQ